MLDPLLTCDVDAGIATLSLNSPATLNALSEAMLSVLASTLDRISQDADIRVVLLRGNGRAFCAGHDLREMRAARDARDKGAAAYEELFQRCSRVMQTIVSLPQPVIAVVHGSAAAAGCQLAATCDMIVAADTARFGVNGVNIGLFCSTPMVALTRKIPPAIAFEMLTTGDFISADRAYAVGLVNRVVPEASLQHESRALAETLAGKLTAAVRIGKRAFYDQMMLALPDAYTLTGSVIRENLMWRDTKEGIDAFLEKRAPDWQEK